jgi:lipopolysaccharide transport system permease protein
MHNAEGPAMAPLTEASREAAERAGPAAPDSAVSDPAALLPLTVIEKQTGWLLFNLHELWHYRELFIFLTWRDVKVRYKQTVLGAAWAVLQPLATMIVFSLFVGKLPGVVSEKIAPLYPLFILIGLIAWNLFAGAISNAGGSVVGSQDLVTKVYFPRLVIPMGSVGVSFFDFAISAVLLVPMMFWYHVAPGWNVLLAPVMLFFLVVAALGVGTLLSALTVAYRDFRYVVPFMIQLWMLATPSIYMEARGVVGEHLAALLPLNPAYGLILNLRQVLIGGAVQWPELIVSAAVSLVLLAAGCLYFRRVERHFADII